MSDAGRDVLWSAKEVATVAGGSALLPFDATGVSIDSRTVVPGDLFIAVVGPNHDGHDHVADALVRGATGALVHRRPENLEDDAPLVMVDDTLDALRALARSARRRGKARVIGVTGSVGKTGTKEALRLVLGNQAPTMASEGNLNNHWGLPLSMARMPRDTRYGVFEIAMNHLGEIHPLSLMAQPDVAVITNVESVHLENFRSEEEIADAKAEIFDGMGADGVAVLNRDNQHYSRLVRAAQQRCLGRTISFGTDPAADVHSILVATGPESTEARFSVLGQEVDCRIGIAGHHWVMNAMAVLAAVAAAGGNVAVAASALKDLQPAPGRGRRHQVLVTGGAFTLIDDSYNASPVSMRAAMAVFGNIAPGPGGRRIAFLGDMLELGPDSPALHAGLAPAIEQAGVDQVFTAGPSMAHLSAAVPASRCGGHAECAEDLLPFISAAVQAGDVVMVKGSYGSRMRVVVEALGSMDASEAEAPRLVANGG